MSWKIRFQPGTIALLAVTSLLAACNWVDSASTDTVVVDDQPVPVAQLLLDDGTPEVSPMAGIIGINEQTSRSLVTTYSGTALSQLRYQWSPQTATQGEIESCANINGIDLQFTESTLQNACETVEDCSLSIVPVDSDATQAQFEVKIPALKASAGLRYQLSVKDEADKETTRDYTFCLIAINEAPIANPDTFAVTDGDELVVDSDGFNILSNDSDDIDVRNRPLTVELVTGPENFSFFELESDGSFRYLSSLQNLREDQTDSFTYRVSDGVNVSQPATVTIRVVATNEAPEQTQVIPILSLQEEETLEFDLADYFEDPEGGEISFSFATDALLPPSDELELSAEGVLSGTPEAGDAGSYIITILVSDGSLVTEARVSLEITPAPLIVPVNSAPEFLSTFNLNRVVEVGERLIPIAPVFVDAEEDTLVYSMVGSAELPGGIRLNERTGVISGIPIERGNANNLRVRATDPSGASAVTPSFFIRVR